MSDLSMSEEKLASVFIKQYNRVKNVNYMYSKIKESSFSKPRYVYPAFYIYKMMFVKEISNITKVSAVFNLFHRKDKLVFEVVCPNTRPEDVKDIQWVRLVENVIDPIERDAFNGVSCSKYLLIDDRKSGPRTITNKELYKIERLKKDQLFVKHKSVNEKLGIKNKKDEFSKQLFKAGIPIKHFFKEIWLIFLSKNSQIQCINIW